MSDFLKQFEGDSYEQDEAALSNEPESLDSPQQQTEENEQEVHDTQPIDEDASSPKDADDTIGMHPVSTKSSDSKRAIARTDHTVKKDSSYDKRKIIRYATIVLSVTVVCLLAFGIFFISNQVTVRDFVGSNVSEARTWGISNRITIEPTEEYSLEFDEGVIMEQDRVPDTRMSRGSVLRVTVSKGPNMTEYLELPNFSTMTTHEVREWRQSVRAYSVAVNEEYSDEIEAGQFIRYEFTDPTVTRENYTRSDGLLIYMSRGVQIFEANIVVPDFFEKPLSDVQEWVRENHVELVIEEDAHDTVPAGHIVAQSAAEGSRIARGDEVIVTVSQGMSIIVPNFSTISFEYAADQRGLEVLVQRRYSESVAFGRLISQSIPAGTELIGEEHQITVIYSLGRPYIDNLVGQRESELAEYFYGFTSRGANITYRIFYVDSYRSRGEIVGMSRYAQFLSLNAHVEISVSRGNLTPPPDADFGNGEIIDDGDDDFYH